MQQLTATIIANLAADLVGRPADEIVQLLTIVLYDHLDIEYLNEAEMREYFDAWISEEEPSPPTEAEEWAEYGDWRYHLAKDEGRL